jgi:hypothetical protein
MPAIPTYQATVGQPGLGFQAQAGTRVDPIAAGLGALGQGLEVGGAALKQFDDKTQHAQATLALATLNNDLRDTHDQIAQGVQDGSVDPTKAISTFAEKANSLKQSAYQGLSPMQQNMIADNVVTTVGGLQRNLNVALFQRKQSDTAATIDSFGEQVDRSAQRIGAAQAADKFDAFVDFAGPEAGLSPEKISKLKQTKRESLYFNSFDAAGTDAFTKGDAAGVAEVRRQLMSPDGDALDPKKRITLNHQLYGLEQNILAKQAAANNAAQRLQDQREVAAAGTVNAAMTQAAAGQPFSPEYIKQIVDDTTGTRQQGMALQLLSGQSPVTGFATKSAPERAQFLNEQQTLATTQGTDPEQMKTLSMLRTIDSNIASQVKENPWVAAQKSGVVTEAPAFDAKNLDSAFPILQKRMADIGAIEQWTGSKVNPFQPQELRQISQGLKQLAPDRAAAYLGAMGNAIGDPDRIALVADELDKGDKPTALALKAGVDKTSAGRVASEFILRGATALQDKTVKKDDTVLAGWRAEIANMVRGTLGDPRAESDIIDAAYYTRAGLDVDGQSIPGFKRADQTNKNAVKMVIGQPLDRGGVKTFLPRGMDENRFDQGVKTFTPEVLKTISPSFYVRGQEIKPEQLANRLTDFGMRRDGSRRYIPVSNGAFVTTDAAGTQPLRLNVP